MNELVKKILERLEESSVCEDNRTCNYCQRNWCPLVMIERDEVEKIVNEVAEEYNGGWIPCSEKLPECGTKVLVQYGCGRINIEECKKNNDGIIGFYDGNYWSNADNYSAWQPLPEPFKDRD